MIDLKLTDTQATIIIHDVEAQISNFKELLAKHFHASDAAKSILNNAIKAREELIKLIDLS